MDYRGAEDHPLKETCGLWCDLIAKAKQVKERLFGGTARECMQFYNGPHDFMYGTKNARNAIGMYLDQNVRIKTTFKVTTNKVAELVQRFGPSLYFNNPHRQVSPRKPELSAASMQMFGMLYGNAFDPMAGQMAVQQAMQVVGQRQMTDVATAELMEWLLNYTPNELDLQRHSRRAITETLIKGMGCLWTEVHQASPDGPRLIGSFYDSCDRLILDPDCETPETAKWICRECVHPVWEVEDEYGLPRGSIKGNFESSMMAGMIENRAEFNRDRFEGKTNDLLVYYKLYSLMGIGGRLKGQNEDLQDVLDVFGDEVFLAVAKNIPFPLNLPPQALEVDTADPAALQQALAPLRWPIRFHEDGTWPVSILGFHMVPGSPYPMSHLYPGLGELRFINWCLSFLADKVHVTSRDLIAIAEHLDQDVKKTITEGDNLEVIHFKKSSNRKVDEMIQWIQHPPMNRDILEIVQIVMGMFDKRVGLTELLYGMSATQDRSATETNIKSKMTTIVVDDMAACAQRWQTEAARKEALASRWLLSPADLAPRFGEAYSPDPNMPQIGPMTSLWAQLCYRPWDDMNPQAARSVTHELDYRIEADSLRKPDTARDLENVDQFIQSPMAALIQQRYQMTGDPTQINALIEAWAKPRQLDPTPFLFPPFQPMPAPMPGDAGPPQGAAA